MASLSYNPEINTLNAPTTGGNLPATPVTSTAPPTGGNLPPIPVPTSAPPTGGNLPPIQVPTTINGSQYVATTTQGIPGNNLSAADVIKGINEQFQTPPGTRAAPTQLTLDSLNQILNSGSPFMQNAARRGRELAGARGLMNSSIAAGASQRAALESAMPILNQSMNLNNQRETQDFQSMINSRNQAFDTIRTRDQNAFTAQQNQLDRTQQVNNSLLAAELRRNDNVDTAKIQNWLNNESFVRQFNGQIRMLPIQTAADLTAAMTQLAVTEPELYTPQIVSGMTQFFHNNMLSILQQYFPTGG